MFGFFRNHAQSSVLVLAKFMESDQPVEGRLLRQIGMRKTMIDLFAGQAPTAVQELVREPYQLMVLSRPV